MAATTRTTDSTESLGRRFVEASWNRDFDDIKDVVSADYAGVSSSQPAGISGLEDLKQSITAIRAAFSDSALTIGVVSVNGDDIWVNWRVRGTNDGAFMGQAPTGKPATLMGQTLCRVIKGKIHESKTTVFRAG